MFLIHLPHAILHRIIDEHVDADNETVGKWKFGWYLYVHIGIEKIRLSFMVWIRRGTVINS